MFDRDDKFDPTYLVPIVVGLLVVGFIAFVVWAIVNHASGIQAGYVFRKEYSPASDYTTTQTTTDGKTTTTSYVPHYESEKFMLWIRGINNKGEQRENWVYVPKDVWDKAQLGQWFDSACMCIVAK